MTRLLRHALVLTALVFAFAVPHAVQASTASECQGQIDALATATDAATFAGRQAEKEEAGLLGKLNGASAALAAGKTLNAAQKLTDFRSHVVTIGEAGKLDSTDAATLAGLADDAIACVNSIGA